MRWLSRAVVAESSMVPTLAAGEHVVVLRGAAVRVGDVVVLRHPDRPQLLLVKRLARPGAAPGTWEVASDNPAVGVDSRGFGPVLAGAVLGRVLWRTWPWRDRGWVR